MRHRDGRLHGQAWIDEGVGPDKAIPLAERLVSELSDQEEDRDEALLTLSDFMIVLKEVDYEAVEGALPRKAFDQVFQMFLTELAEDMNRAVAERAGGVSKDVLAFWHKVMNLCRN